MLADMIATLADSDASRAVVSWLTIMLDAGSPYAFAPVIVRRRILVSGAFSIVVLLAVVSVLPWVFWNARALTVSSRELQTDFALNERRANDKYKGRYAIVTGRVTEVGTVLDFLGGESSAIAQNAWLFLADRPGLPECRCAVMETLTLRSVAIGRRISVRGRIEGLEKHSSSESDRILLTDCRIVDSDPGRSRGRLHVIRAPSPAHSGQ